MLEPMSKTLVVRLRTGKIRGDADNTVTRMVVHDEIQLQASFEDLFRCHYDAVLRVYREFTEPGLAMIAIDLDGVAASAFLGTKPDRINVAIIGRHGMADLYLDGDPAVSLRHMVAVLHPFTGPHDIRFRLLDLRTRLGFVDEHGRRLEALEAEGPVFVRCGSYAVFFLPTGDDTPWPDDPADGWQCIPERVYLDEAIAEPDRWERRRLAARWQGADKLHPEERSPRTTRVQTFRGPAMAHRRLVRDDEQPLGELRVRSDAGTTSIAVGRAAAREGILFGRYDRCDNEGLPVLGHQSISRVHLLVIDIGDQLYAIDTASTNGVFVDKQEVRVRPLGADLRLVIGEDLAVVHWRAGQ